MDGQQKQSSQFNVKTKVGTPYGISTFLKMVIFLNDYYSNSFYCNADILSIFS